MVISGYPYGSPIRVSHNIECPLSGGREFPQAFLSGCSDDLGFRPEMGILEMRGSSQEKPYREARRVAQPKSEGVPSKLRLGGDSHSASRRSFSTTASAATHAAPLRSPRFLS